MSDLSCRRSFLKHSAAGIGATALAPFAEVRAALAAATTRLAPPKEEAGWAQLAQEYLLAPDVTYLNHASIGTIPRAVHQARQRYLEICETNPWLYMWGGAWEEALQETRSKAAGVLGCEAAEVAITHNTTEMFNTLAHGLPLKAGDEVLFSTLCHVGASEAFRRMDPARGVQIRQFEFPLNDLRSLTAAEVVAVYARQIRPATRLLLLPHIDNTVGIRHPIAELARMAREQGVEFVAVDAAQSVGMIPVDVHRMDVDVVATSPHKWLQTPKGLGLAYVHPRLHERLRPMWVTWGQGRWPVSARRFEDYGTRNMPEVLALGDAIDVHSTLEPLRRAERLHQLWQHAQARVQQEASLQWVSPADWDLSGSLVAVEATGKPADELAQTLYREHGIVVRPFRTLGLNTLRISPNVVSTPAQLDRLFDVLCA